MTPSVGSNIPLQILWCSHCATAFTFTDASVECTAGGNLAVRYEDCGALSEIAAMGGTKTVNPFRNTCGAQ